MLQTLYNDWDISATILRQGYGEGLCTMTEFFIPMLLPTRTQQEHKVAVVHGKPQFYEPAELKYVRQKFRDYLATHVPTAPYEGAVQLVTKWCFPLSGKHTDGEWRTTKPDTDNLVKLLKDEMTKLHFWGDDAQVASEIIQKFWARIPGLYIAMEELT